MPHFQISAEKWNVTAKNVLSLHDIIYGVQILLINIPTYFFYNKMKTIKYLFALALMSVMLTGCGLDDKDEFLGTWESYAFCDGYEEFEQYDYERMTYCFYDDGTGYYIQGTIRTTFYWDKMSGRHLYLRHSDGLTEDIYYRFDRGDMLMSGEPSFHTYTVFQYVGTW